jgi:hypothetical protein
VPISMFGLGGQKVFAVGHLARNLSDTAF